MTSVICRSLKQSLPNCTVDYLVHDISAPMLQGQAFVDNVISVTSTERKNPFKYLTKIWKLRSNNYDIIIDAASTTKSSLISLLSPATKYRIGREKKTGGYFYTHKILRSEQSGHKIQSRLAMLAPLIKAGFAIQPVAEMALTVTDSNMQKMRQQLIANDVDLARPLIAFSVSSRLPHKKWRLDYQAEVARHCINNYNAQIVLYSGSQHEVLDLQNFHHLMQYSPDVFPNLRTKNLLELMGLLAHSSMFIGNDCGPRHIAQALGVPGVAVFSPSASRSEWLPSDGRRYRGIEWRDVCEPRDNQMITIDEGDPLYTELYDSITPTHVISVVDEIAREYFT